MEMQYQGNISSKLCRRGYARNEPESPGNQSKDKVIGSTNQMTDIQGEERMNSDRFSHSDKQIYGEMMDVPDVQVPVDCQPAVEMQPVSL